MVYNDFTVNELIKDVLTDFLYLYGADFENIRGRDMTRGIKLVNEILNEDNVPLLHTNIELEIELEANLNGEILFNDNLYNVGGISTPREIREVLGVKLLTNVTDGVVENLSPLSEGEYLHFNRTLSHKGKPAYYRYIKGPLIKDGQPGQTDVLWFYPTPDKNYTAYVECRSGHNIVITQDTVQEVLSVPAVWMGYLRYALARKFKDYFPNAKYTQAMESEYLRLYSIISVPDNMDTMAKKDNALLDNSYWDGYSRWGCY